MEFDSDLTDLDDELAPGPPVKKETGIRPGDYRLPHVLRAPRTTTYSAESLLTEMHEQDIELEPEYQREVVWPETKQIKLIDSLLRNFYIPPVIFCVTHDDLLGDRKVCIDGKQRLTSIRRFMDGEIPHQDSDTKKKYWFKANGTDKGKSKVLLPPYLKKQFSQKQIVCIEYDSLEKSWEREIFQRVQLGMPLQAAERMAAHTGPWAILAGELKNEFFGKDCPITRSVIYDITRARDFLTMAQILMAVSSTAKVHFTSAALDKWLKTPEPPTEQFKADIRGVLHDMTAVFDSDTFKGQRISPVEFVMTAILIYEQRKRGVALEALVNYSHQFRTQLRAEYVDLRINTKVIASAWKIIDNFPKATQHGSGKRKQQDIDDEEYRGSTGSMKTQRTNTRSQAMKLSQSPTLPRSPFKTGSSSTTPSPTKPTVVSHSLNPPSRLVPHSPVPSSSQAAADDQFASASRSATSSMTGIARLTALRGTANSNSKRTGAPQMQSFFDNGSDAQTINPNNLTLAPPAQTTGVPPMQNFWPNLQNGSHQPEPFHPDHPWQGSGPPGSSGFRSNQPPPR